MLSLAAPILVLALASAPPGADLALFLPPLEQMAPLRPAGEVERYTPDNLWEKIDGEAELYRRFGLEGSVAAGYASPEDPTRRIEVTLHGMASPLGAFGLFASFRAPGDDVEDTGNGGIVGQRQAFFWHGRLFILVDAFGPDDARPQDLRRAVTLVSAELGPPPPKPPLLAAFESLAKPGTVQYVPDHLLSRASLPPGLEGEDAEGLSFFVATQETTAVKVLDDYATDLSAQRRPVWEGMQVLAGVDPAHGPVTLAWRDGRLAGARAGYDRAGLREILARLLALPADGP